ncbi:Uncharacterised protein at_DN2621 [Pycnogonum litorale]
MERKPDRDENPGFVNLTEFSRVSVGRMLSCLAVRLIIISGGNRIKASNRLRQDMLPGHSLTALGKVIIQADLGYSVVDLVGGNGIEDVRELTEIICKVLTELIIEKLSVYLTTLCFQHLQKVQ